MFAKKGKLLLFMYATTVQSFVYNDSQKCHKSIGLTALCNIFLNTFMNYILIELIISKCRTYAHATKREKKTDRLQIESAHFKDELKSDTLLARSRISNPINISQSVTTTFAKKTLRRANILQ